MSKWRKKPVVVDAIQFFPGEVWDMEGLFTHTKPDYRTCQTCGHEMRKHAYVKTLEGEMRACPGDWIITDIKGERYPCKPDIFEATYEPAEEGNEQ